MIARDAVMENEAVETNSGKAPKPRNWIDKQFVENVFAEKDIVTQSRTIVGAGIAIGTAGGAAISYALFPHAVGIEHYSHVLCSLAMGSLAGMGVSNALLLGKARPIEDIQADRHMRNAAEARRVLSAFNKAVRAVEKSNRELAESTEESIIATGRFKVPENEIPAYLEYWGIKDQATVLADRDRAAVTAKALIGLVSDDFSPTRALTMKMTLRAAAYPPTKPAVA